MYVEGLAERSDVAITLDVADSVGRLPSDMELAIFRLVQECLTNIHRHSGSKTALIRIAREGESVRAEVQDHGKGISPERLSEIQSHGSGRWDQGNSRAYTSIPRRNENRVECFRYFCDCKHSDAQGSPFSR